jgi:hypothetical protein
MTAIELEIQAIVQKLAPEQKQKVLAFVEALEHTRPLTTDELLALPYEERQKAVRAAIESAKNEDFEVFEAYGEGDEEKRS